MHNFITRVSLTALLIGLACTSSMASAATFAQAGTSFTATGSIATAVKLLVFTPVPCNLALTGQVAADGSSASITGATFFFSSRRRHTRYWRDWSSDVCSSDLDAAAQGARRARRRRRHLRGDAQ